MIIGSHDTGRQPMLIAEIGNNHEGDAGRALELADAAVESGATAVKVQIIDPAHLVNVAQTERIAQLTRFRLPYEVFMRMAERVRSRGRLFMASVFDCASLTAAQRDLDAIKIASGDLDFDPLLEVAAASGRPIILSTGMSTLDEILRAVEVIRARVGAAAPLADRLAVLHCVSRYPTALDQANLRAIPCLAAALPVTIGYSDHTLGIEAAVTAVALGARIVEKHFTLDKNLSSFRDHALSAEPREFARLADVMGSFEAMLGSGARDGALPDADTRAVARRSVVASRALPAGTRLTTEDLDYVRPAGGIAPSQVATVVGRRLRRQLAHHELIQKADLD